MKIRWILLVTLLALVNQNIVGQGDTSRVNVNGYLEIYYNYDFGNPANQNRPSFVYSHNRHNEVNLNVGFIKASRLTERWRFNLGLMSGTYANANLALEPSVLKNCYEANVGVRLSKQKMLWLDAGILPSHIGFESAVGKDCWSLTRSILADNSPYYESGAKISFTSDNGKWFVSALLLNGWQKIQRQAGNNTLAFGHQLMYKPSDKFTVNSSSFVGSDVPDSVQMFRYFHNFFAQVALHKRIGLIVGFDYGIQQKSKGSMHYNNWCSPVAIARFVLSDRVAAALRAEYYTDANQVIVVTGTKNGVATTGYSCNLDYNLHNNIVLRIEGRWFQAKDKIFTIDDKPANDNFFITTALAASF